MISAYCIPALECKHLKSINDFISSVEEATKAHIGATTKDLRRPHCRPVFPFLLLFLWLPTRTSSNSPLPPADPTFQAAASHFLAKPKYDFMYFMSGPPNKMAIAHA